MILMNLMENTKTYINNIVEPVQYNRIEFKDNKQKISYTDCFEISLLRFLHSIFLKKVDYCYKMDIQRMATYMYANKHCKQIIKFFLNNPDIHLDADYYENEGYPLRTKWCIFLNKRPFFRYKLEDKFEVCASPENLFSFFRIFFPKIYLDQPTNQDKLHTLVSSLSTDDLKINVNLKSDCRIASGSYYFTDLMTFEINGVVLYDWLLYQYFEKIGNKVGKRITGHSDLHFNSNYHSLVYDSNEESESEVESNDNADDSANELSIAPLSDDESSDIDTGDETLEDYDTKQYKKNLKYLSRFDAFLNSL